MPPGEDRGALEVRARRFVWGARTYVMGIVNVTPDSFSGDGREACDAAVAHALAQYAAGADLLDIGGESTRPGHVRIDEATELARVVPVVREVRARLPEVPISIDSYKPAVVRAAHAAGADIVNSIWGASDALLEVAAKCAMPLIAMHNQAGTAYAGDVVDEVVTMLAECARRAGLHGLPRERVLLDPGIGFGKTPDQNVAVLRGLDRLRALGHPMLIGTSRKSSIGRLTGRAVGDRLFGSLAATALAVEAGVDVVRVHDVAATRDAVAVADAWVRDWRPPEWTA